MRVDRRVGQREQRRVLRNRLRLVHVQEGLRARVRPVGGATILEADLADVPDDALLATTGGRRFDVILSDMAPKTTGDGTTDVADLLELLTQWGACE